MATPLTSSEVARWLNRLQRAANKPECCSCDCYLGLLTQLQLDAADDIAHLLQPLKSKDPVHGCLGCDPCSPGAVFANYLRGPCNCGCNCKYGDQAPLETEQRAIDVPLHHDVTQAQTHGGRQSRAEHGKSAESSRILSRAW